MSQHLIIPLVLSALTSAATWKVQDWRYAAKEKERVELQLGQVQANAATAVRRTDNVILAQNAAAARGIADRRAAAAVRDELGRVQSASAASVEAARASHQACIDNAASLKSVFDSCSKRYGELAETADGHVNDVQTLSDAWPK